MYIQYNSSFPFVLNRKISTTIVQILFGDYFYAFIPLSLKQCLQFTNINRGGAVLTALLRADKRLVPGTGCFAKFQNCAFCKL